MTDQPKETMTGKERRERAQRLRETGAQNLGTREGYERYLTVLARHSDRSAKNCLMILAQKPDATLLNSFEGWKAIGRNVRKGEKSIVITGGDYREPAEGGDKRFFTKDVFAFDVSQTEGDDSVLEHLGPDPIDDPIAAMGRVESLVRSRYQLSDGAPVDACDPIQKTIELASHANPTRRSLAMVRQFSKARADFALKGDAAAGELVADSVAWLYADRLGLDFAKGELGFSTLGPVIVNPALRDEVLDQVRRNANWIFKACAGEISTTAASATAA